MKKIYFIIISILLLAFLWYYLSFVKEVKMDNGNDVLICLEKNKDSLNIYLGTGFYYITRHDYLLKKDTLYIDVYATTVVNVFNKKKDTSFSIDIFDVKYIKFTNNIYRVDSFRNCQ